MSLNCSDEGGIPGSPGGIQYYYFEVGAVSRYSEFCVGEGY